MDNSDLKYMAAFKSSTTSRLRVLWPKGQGPRPQLSKKTVTQSVCVCHNVCVCERESERKKERLGERISQAQVHKTPKCFHQGGRHQERLVGAGLFVGQAERAPLVQRLPAGQRAQVVPLVPTYPAGQ